MLGWLHRLASKVRTGQPPNEVLPIDLAAIPGALAEADGLPRPQWEIISTAVGPLTVRYRLHRVWCEVQRQWLEALVAALGPDDNGHTYRIVETQSVLLLCAAIRENDVASLARLCENTLSVVRSILGSAAERCGKLPVFIFESIETYYTYISYFYPDGEYGTSGGACLGAGDRADVHIATYYTADGLERTLAHEMVHAELEADVPVWIQEGVAEIISRHIARAGPLLLTPADVQRQRHYWNKRGMDAFWSGSSFQRNDRGQTLSYTLAEVLVQNLLCDHRRRFRDFLSGATIADSGEAAAREHLDISLGDLVAQFIGEGHWAPRVTASDAT